VAKFPGKTKDKPIVLQIFFFKAYFKSKKNPDKLKNRVFKVYATKFARAKLRVENYCEREKIKVINVAGIEPRQAQDREWIELGLPKDKKIRLDKLELKRLIKLKHNTFGFIWIADPLLPVTKRLVGNPVAFFVPQGKDHVMVKTIKFEPQYFDLKIDVKEKLNIGAQQERKSKINTIRQHLAILELNCERATDVDLDVINDVICDQVKFTAKQNKKYSTEVAKRIVEDFHRLRKIKQQGNVKYSVPYALRKAFRKDIDNTIQDLEVACELLRKEGYKIMDPQSIF